MVDVVVLNKGEHASHPADDASLLAVVDVAPPHNVAANLFLQPAVVLPAADGVPLHLGGGFDVHSGEVVVIVRVAVFAQGDPGTFGVGDFAVLNDPALGPVGTDHAVLVGGGRGPGGGRLGDAEPADGDVVQAGLAGVEAETADVDFHIFRVGVLALEIGVEYRVVAVLFGIPLVDRSLRFPGAGIYLALDAFFQAAGLVHGLVVEVHAAGVLGFAGKVPVPVHKGGVGVVIAEQAVGNPHRPDIAPVECPVFRTELTQE